MAKHYSNDPGIQQLRETIDSIPAAHEPLSADELASVTPSVREWLELPQKVLARIEAEKSQQKSNCTTPKPADEEALP